MRKAEGVGVGQGLVWEEEGQSREATCSPTPEHWHWDCWPGSCTERKGLQIPCRLQLLLTLVKEGSAPGDVWAGQSGLRGKKDPCSVKAP